jgi:hypothetical protein
MSLLSTLLLAAKEVALSVLANYMYDRASRAPRPKVAVAASALTVPAAAMIALWLARTRWLLPDEYWDWAILASMAAVVAVPWIAPVRRPRAGALVLAVVVALVLVADERCAREVYLACPAPLVGDQGELDGRVRDPLRFVYVVVHPTAVPERYTQQVAIVGADGTWRHLATYGGERGVEYDVVAIASPAPLPIRDGILPRVIPPNVAYSRACRLTKG